MSAVKSGGYLCRLSLKQDVRLKFECVIIKGLTDTPADVCVTLTSTCSPPSVTSRLNA